MAKIIDAGKAKIQIVQCIENSSLAYRFYKPKESRTYKTNRAQSKALQLLCEIFDSMEQE